MTSFTAPSPLLIGVSALEHRCEKRKLQLKAKAFWRTHLDKADGKATAGGAISVSTILLKTEAGIGHAATITLRICKISH
jgi:hypothetical protein